MKFLWCFNFKNERVLPLCWSQQYENASSGQNATVLDEEDRIWYPNTSSIGKKLLRYDGFVDWDSAISKRKSNCFALALYCLQLMLSRLVRGRYWSDSNALLRRLFVLCSSPRKGNRQMKRYCISNMCWSLGESSINLFLIKMRLSEFDHFTESVCSVIATSIESLKTSSQIKKLVCRVWATSFILCLQGSSNCPIVIVSVGLRMQHFVYVWLSHWLGKCMARRGQQIGNGLRLPLDVRQKLGWGKVGWSGAGQWTPTNNWMCFPLSRNCELYAMDDTSPTGAHSSPPITRESGTNALRDQ